MPTFALIHSPLVSPFTWQATAAVLRRRGYAALVPDLRDTPGAGPYWRQHIAAAAQALAAAPRTGPLVLVAHSGAGALLPGLGQALAEPVAAYLFVDAGWPAGGQSRLQSFGGAGEVERFRAFLAAGGRFPDWQADDLAAILPEAAVRAQLVAELRPRGLDYWDEPLPLVPGWPNAPVGYLRYTATYQPDAARAAALGWPVHVREAGHFEMLAQPDAAAAELLALLAEVLRGGRMADWGGALDRQLFETRTVLVFGELTPALVQRVSQQVLLLAARSAAGIKLLINAQGGTVASGEALLDLLRGAGVGVKTIGAGAVANAAALAYLAPPRAQRYCLPHARFSFYQSFTAPGGDVLAAAPLVAQQRARVAALVAQQSGQPPELVERDLERAYWLDAAEARQYGLVGQVIEGLDEVG